ncbi:hypothetical protein SASPL_115023 [Salvia splendens]|uniref:Uncharacterized protein n=1 Tax=Salvia splendens TaxID=180675 RepID=A0A8X8Y1N9_SALSN|nr:hypothetical protein SASPL_115023 [Salvia splendens]
MLKLKKSKSANGENLETAEDFGAPLVNLFTRESNSKEKPPIHDSETNLASDERKMSKEIMTKYLKMVKPFYIRISKRYMKKQKLPGGGGGSNASL